MLASVKTSGRPVEPRPRLLTLSLSEDPYAEHSKTPSKWDVIAAAIGTRRTASAAEQRWLLMKNKSAPAPSAQPAKKRKKSEKRVEKKKKKQRSRVWDLDKKKYVTS